MGIYVVSSCLLGYRCRYDGRSRPSALVTATGHRELMVPVCPEILGGLGVPRDPSEITGGDGKDVLQGRARVMDATGRDVTEEYLRGSRLALGIALQSGARAAILKQKSPACGAGIIYDGTFRKSPRPGYGVFAALVREYGMPVYPEERAREILGKRV